MKFLSYFTAWLHTFLIRMPNFFWASIFLKTFTFEPKIILILFLTDTKYKSAWRSKKNIKLLLICYFIIETKQKQNRTINLALGVFQTIKRESHICLLSKNIQIFK